MTLTEGEAESISHGDHRLDRRCSVVDKLSRSLKQGIIRVMPYKLNPGVARACSECGETFIAVIANSLTCSAACALRRKTAFQRGRRLARGVDSFPGLGERPDGGSEELSEKG